MSIFQQLHNEDLFHTSLLLLTTIFCIYFLRKWLCNINPNNTKAPSPPRLPILGNIHQLSPLTFRSFRSLGARYGPIMLLHFGARPAVIVQSADAAGEIMRTHDLAFADKPNTRTTRRIFYDLKDVILAPYGEHWRKLKSICILQLLSSKRVGSFRSIREEETSLLMDKISESRGSPLNLSELFAVLGNDVICRAAFGRKYSEGEEGKKFLVLLREVVQLFGAVSIGEFIPWLSWINRVNGYDRRVDRIAREVDDFLEMVVQEHLDGGLVKDHENTENFVDILIVVFQENSEGVSINRDSIKAIILDMLAGATDTTSAALEWAMAELLKHPIALKNLQTEVREILKDRRAISDEDLGKMQYLKAVVKETLRLHPPLPLLGREAREDITVMGNNIKSKTMIIINAWAIGRDPASWDEPKKFLPERFLDCSIDYKGVHFELIPFGAGRRGCPGISFATVSVELVLANLVHKFEWGLPDGINLEDLDMTEQPGGTSHRKYPLYAVATMHRL